MLEPGTPGLGERRGAEAQRLAGEGIFFFPPLKPILVHAAPSELADFHLSSFPSVFSEGREPSSFCVTDSCHLVPLGSPGPPRTLAPRKPPGEAEGQAPKTHPGPRETALSKRSRHGLGLWGKNIQEEPKEGQTGEQRSEEEGLGDAVRGGWRTRALLWRLLPGAQHSSKAEAPLTHKISPGDPPASGFAAGAARVPGRKARRRQPPAGCPAALGAQSPYSGLGPEGLQMRSGKTPPAAPHSCPEPLLCAAPLASPRSPQSHAQPLSAQPGASVSPSPPRASPEPRGSHWDAVPGGLRGVSHPLHPTNCPAPVLPALGAAHLHPSIAPQHRHPGRAFLQVLSPIISGTIRQICY